MSEQPDHLLCNDAVHERIEATGNGLPMFWEGKRWLALPGGKRPAAPHEAMWVHKVVQVQ